jgi:hypothetical protein
VKLYPWNEVIALGLEVVVRLASVRQVFVGLFRVISSRTGSVLAVLQHKWRIRDSPERPRADSMEIGYVLAGGWVFREHSFFQGRLEGAAVGVCKDQRI